MAASAPVPSFDLGGRVALITGAGRGIGAAIGRAAAAAGAPAVLSARSVPQLEAAARGNGAIVFVGSLTSERLGLPTTAGYAAAKSGLLGLMRTFAVALAPYGVRANTLLPGFVATELTRAPTRRRNAHGSPGGFR